MNALLIEGREVAPARPPYVIAEVGSNHNGSLDLCMALVDAAKEAGADAVKFQSWSDRSLVSRAEYERNTSYTDPDRHFGSLRAMIEAYQFTPAMHERVASRCRDIGITFLSTPFALEEVALLESLGVGAYKVASMDVNHPVLLRAIAATGKPVILSTGMATLGEIERAVTTLDEAGSGAVALLHCVAEYPPDPDDVNLHNIGMLRRAFDRPVGFSDHTLGIAVPLAAVALGACIVEKHFTLDKGTLGWDHAISADPPELAALVRDARLVHRALGRTVRRVGGGEMKKRQAFRRCIVLRRAVPAGHALDLADLDFKRPGTGIEPDQYPLVVGRTTRRALEADDELGWADLA